MALMSDPIYLDHNATTPLLPEVLDAMRACYTVPYLNPSSQHELGRRARGKLEEARERIAELVGANTSGANADQVIFTSGGTEANNLAVFGLAGNEGRFPGQQPRRAVISAFEHPSIAAAADELSRRGWQVDRLRPTPAGTIQPADLPALVRPETRLVAVMLAQNETGVVQPVVEVAAHCREHGVPLHTDAVQAVGKIPVDFRRLGVATMSLAAHKFHGPLGIGALVVRHGVDLTPQLFGGFQQGALRPGSEPVALAVGMCRALELWHAEHDTRAARLRELRDRFERQILAAWPTAVVIGGEAPRLPQTSSIAFVGLERQALFMALDQAGVACSTGSACASGSSEPSPALVTSGLQPAIVSSALRFSLGATTTAAEVDDAVRRILHCGNHLRSKKDR